AFGERELPEVGPGAILVRISYAGICGSDLHRWRGDIAMEIPPAGLVAGHEATGRVAALGRGVTTDALGAPLREGDRVVYSYFYPCRRCAYCLRGQLAACPTRSLGRRSGWDEFPHFH